MESVMASGSRNVPLDSRYLLEETMTRQDQLASSLAAYSAAAMMPYLSHQLVSNMPLTSLPSSVYPVSTMDALPSHLSLDDIYQTFTSGGLNPLVAQQQLLMAQQQQIYPEQFSVGLGLNKKKLSGSKHPRCLAYGCTKFARRTGSNQYCMKHMDRRQKRWCISCNEHIAQYSGGKCTLCSGRKYPRRVSQNVQHLQQQQPQPSSEEDAVSVEGEPKAKVAKIGAPLEYPDSSSTLSSQSDSAALAANLLIAASRDILLRGGSMAAEWEGNSIASSSNMSSSSAGSSFYSDNSSCAASVLSFAGDDISSLNHLNQLIEEVPHHPSPATSYGQAPSSASSSALFESSVPTSGSAASILGVSSYLDTASYVDNYYVQNDSFIFLE